MRNENTHITTVTRHIKSWSHETQSCIERPITHTPFFNVTCCRKGLVVMPPRSFNLYRSQSLAATQCYHGWSNASSVRIFPHTRYQLLYYVCLKGTIPEKPCARTILPSYIPRISFAADLITILRRNLLGGPYRLTPGWHGGGIFAIRYIF
jgi:hypothetical protein